MRLRMLIASVAMIGFALPLAPSGAASDYACHADETLAISLPAGSTGPSCDFVVSCPTSLDSCAVEVKASASGIGAVGVAADGVAPTECTGSGSCEAPATSGILLSGEEASVVCSWTGALAVFAAVDCEAELLSAGPLITVEVEGPGSVTSNPPGIDCGSDCIQPFQPGTLITVTAQADEGATVDFAMYNVFCVDGSDTPTISTCTFFMPDESFTVSFGFNP